MSLTLDRMALEDVGAEPQRVSEAILAQMQYRSGPVPIEEVACALGILEIRREPLTNMEGALLTTPERHSGKILVNSNASRRRRRFTVAHELGHFMNPYHGGAEAGGLSCSTKDTSPTFSPAIHRHRRQEDEANRFAIEILAPRMRCRTFLSDVPDIAEIFAIAKEFDISREAAARRYVELHGDAVAVVFTKQGLLAYYVRTEGCPALSVRRGEALSLPPAPADIRVPTEMAYVDTSLWLQRGKCELLLQTFFQEKGYAMSLLRLIIDHEEELEIDDTYDRFARFGETR
jgi:hypothetical protein